MPALVVPGVRVEAKFDILPPLPAPSGILGAVGIVDRPPRGSGLTSVTKITEIAQLLGPGTVSSMPEVSHALANGVSEVVIAAVEDVTPDLVHGRICHARPLFLFLVRVSSRTAGSRSVPDVDS